MNSHEKTRFTLSCSRCAWSNRYGRSLALVCPACAGELDFSYQPAGGPDELRHRFRERRQGVWRYRELLPVSPRTQVLSLGEGGTPMIRASGRRLAGAAELLLKLDFVNPTGSFKDRQSTCLVTALRNQGPRGFVTASTGNIGASIAAYSGLTGLPCVVLVGRSTPLAKVRQIVAHGALLVRMPGDFIEQDSLGAYRLVARLARALNYVPVVAWREVNPLPEQGGKTMAFEILEDLGWEVPDWVFVPVGGGSLLVSVWRGFAEAAGLGLSTGMPRLAGVVPCGCNTLKRIVDGGWEGEGEGEGQHAHSGSGPAPPSPPAAATRVSGVALSFPLEARRAVQALADTGGTVVEVEDSFVSEVSGYLAREEGVLTELAGALPVAGFMRALGHGTVRPGQKAVCCLTGSGLKTLDHDAEHLPPPVDAPLSACRDDRDLASFILRAVEEGFAGSRRMMMT